MFKTICYYQVWSTYCGAVINVQVLQFRASLISDSSKFSRVGYRWVRPGKGMTKEEFLTTEGCAMYHTAVRMRFVPPRCRLRRHCKSFRVAIAGSTVCTLLRNCFAIVQKMLAWKFTTIRIAKWLFNNRCSEFYRPSLRILLHNTCPPLNNVQSKFVECEIFPSSRICANCEEGSGALSK